MTELTQERRERLRDLAQRWRAADCMTGSEADELGWGAGDLLDALDAAEGDAALHLSAEPRLAALEAEVARLLARRAVLCPKCGGCKRFLSLTPLNDGGVGFGQAHVYNCPTCNGEGAVLVDAPDAATDHKAAIDGLAAPHNEDFIA